MLSALLETGKLANTHLVTLPKMVVDDLNFAKSSAAACLS